MAPLQGVVSMEGGSVTPGNIQVNMVLNLDSSFFVRLVSCLNILPICSIVCSCG